MNKNDYTYEAISNEEYFSLKRKFEESGNGNYHIFNYKDKTIAPDFDIPQILGYFEFEEPDYEVDRIFFAEKGVILEIHKKQVV